MKAADIAGTGIWAASAVAVAGYTYSAFKTSYSQFPNPSGSGAAITSSPLGTTPGVEANQIKITDNAVKKIPLVGGPLAAGSQALRRIFNRTGAQSLTDAETGRLQRLPSPPRQIVRQITANKAMSNPAQQRAVVNAANQLKYWALQHGWKESDVSAYIQFLGVRIF